VQACYTDAVAVSNAVPTEAIRALFHEAQLLQADKKVRVIPSHCETRFGSQHLVLRKVLEVQHALRGMCATSKFIELTSKPNSEQAKKLHAVLTSIAEDSLFTSGPILLELVDPIMDAIHKLEGDMSLLSQVLPMIWSVEQHGKAFAEKYPTLSTGFKKKGNGHVESVSLNDVVAKRLRSFIYRPFHAAAWCLDPLFFMLVNGKWKLPYTELSCDEQSDVDECVECMGGKVAGEELLDLIVCDLPTGKLLERLYASCAARTVQDDGSVRIEPTHKRRAVWVNFLKDKCPNLASVAERLMSMHATACASERNWSKWGLLFAKNRASFSGAVSEKIVFVCENSPDKSACVDAELLF
jgi:hypothetical protein